jgi:hypothetical protein
MGGLALRLVRLVGELSDRADAGPRMMEGTGIASFSADMRRRSGGPATQRLPTGTSTSRYPVDLDRVAQARGERGREAVVRACGQRAMNGTKNTKVVCSLVVRPARPGRSYHLGLGPLQRWLAATVCSLWTSLRVIAR